MSGEDSLVCSSGASGVVMNAVAYVSNPPPPITIRFGNAYQAVACREVVTGESPLGLKWYHRSDCG